MELSVKQFFTRIRYSSFLAISFLSCGILIQLSLPSEAAIGIGDRETRRQGDKENINFTLSPSSPSQILAQQTSVDELSDVRPTDWAYQALKSLIEKYNVKVGLPDGTFRGNRALTRYEFAAGLDATLNKVDELIASSANNR
ncbi:MAG: iron uptake porin, partial [Cyanobacteriota bacterium]|nr:iron uptake porin [Cyanobacteriota bacterium]